MSSTPAPRSPVTRPAPADLACTRLHSVLTPTGTTRLPTWKGSLVRGALGWALAEVAQAAPAPAWPGLRTRSFAEALFDFQRAWADQRAVAPWTLRCAERQRSWTPHDSLAVTLTLHGPWESWSLALLEDACIRLADQGLGRPRVPWRLDAFAVEEVATHNDRVEPQRVGSIALHTRSPCRVRSTQDGVPVLDPRELTRGLLRRWRRLHLQLHGRDPITEDEGRRLHAAADTLVTVHHAATAHHLERFSSRQQRTHPLPAVSGSLVFTGPDLATWAPLWRRAPDLHIGRQAHFGLGAVAVELLPEIPADIHRAAHAPPHPEAST